MAKQTFSLEQIVAKPRQIELLLSQGKTVPLACKECGIADQRSTGGGENTVACNFEQARKLKDLQTYAQLRRAVAGLKVEKQILKDIAQGNS